MSLAWRGVDCFLSLRLCACSRSSVGVKGGGEILF